jgi:glucose-1-phosphate adenylyltransferase
MRILSVVLAGGEGKRLYPLTRDRAKPAVPFGGRYRIVDFVLSNMLNSGFLRIKVLTQFKSNSLNNHLSRYWALAPNHDIFVELVPAQMRVGPWWYMFVYSVRITYTEWT